MKKITPKIRPALIIALNVLLLIAVFFLLFTLYSRNKTNNMPISNTNDIINGTIEKKENNILKVKGSFASKPNTVPVSIDIVFDNNTALAYLNPPAIPYLYKEPAPVLIQPLIKDVATGLVVNIHTKRDSKKSSAYKAEKIEIVIPPPIAIKGKIVNIVDTLLVIDGTPYPPKSATYDPKLPLVKYSILVSDDMEISRVIPISKNSPNNVPEKAKLSFSELKKDMEVIVYSNIYIGNAQSFTAFRIEPVIKQSFE